MPLFQVHKIFFLMLLLIDFCSAQLLDTLWSKVLDDTCDSEASLTHLIPLKNGDCLVALSGQPELKRVSPDGAILWALTFENVGVKDVIELENGNVIATFIMSYNYIIDSTFVACISAKGTKLWSKVIPKTAHRTIKNGDSLDMLFYNDLKRRAIRRYSPDLTDYRSISYGDDSTLYPTYFSSTPLGGHLFSGEMKINPRDSVLVWCTDFMGKIRWRKSLGSWYDVDIPKIITDANGGIFYALRNRTTESGELVHMDSLGNTLWTKGESLKNQSVGDEFLTELDNNFIALSGTRYDVVNNQTDKLIGIMRVYDKLTGIDKTTFWRLPQPSGSTLQAVELTGGEIVGLTTGSLFGAPLQGRFLKFDWNNPPNMLTKPGDLPSQIKENQKTDYTIIVKDDFPNDKIRFSVRCPGLGNIKIDSITGKMTIFPDIESDTGKKEIVVIATDQVGQSDSITYQIEVEPVNDPPYLSSLKYVFIVTDPSQRNPNITVRIVIQFTEPEGDIFSKESTSPMGVIKWSSDTCYLQYAYDQKQADTLLLLLTDEFSATSSYKIFVNFKTNSVSFMNAKDLANAAAGDRVPHEYSLNSKTSPTLHEAVAYYDLRGRLLVGNQGDMSSFLKRNCVIVAKYPTKSKIYILPAKGCR
jgi:hypothetical protein